ncbi:hypothetical protein SNF32_05445 [Enterococcus mundtii]|nr:hypothetical protein [Enterococcus mundtii]
MFQQLISNITSFLGQNVTFARGEVKIPQSVDLNLSKKTLQTRKDRLSAEFKVLHKESNEWKNDLKTLTKQVLQHREDLENPDFRMDFKRGLESHHSIEHIAAPVINSIESLHSSMLNYAESLIHLNKKRENFLKPERKSTGKSSMLMGAIR